MPRRYLQKDTKQTLAYKKKPQLRKIPERIFTETLEVLENADDALWRDRNPSCAKKIHLQDNSNCNGGQVTGSDLQRLKCIRLCILRRDWRTLAKVLSVSEPAVPHSQYTALYVKYAAICLAHNDKNLLEVLLKSYFGCTNVDGVIEKCTKYPEPTDTDLPNLSTKLVPEVEVKPEPS